MAEGCLLSCKSLASSSHHALGDFDLSGGGVIAVKHF